MPTTTAWIMVWRIGPVSSNLENREEGAFSPFFLYGPADESEPYTATAFGTAPPSCEQKYFCCCPAWPRGFSFQAVKDLHLLFLLKTIFPISLCQGRVIGRPCGGEMRFGRVIGRPNCENIRLSLRILFHQRRTPLRQDALHEVSNYGKHFR